MTGHLIHRVGTFSGGSQLVVFHYIQHLVYKWYFGILKSRIPLTVKIIASMCFNVEFLLCRWISFSVVISLILVECFPKVLLSAKVLVDRVGLLSA
jgi:hypothetical protein